MLSPSHAFRRVLTSKRHLVGSFSVLVHVVLLDQGWMQLAALVDFLLVVSVFLGDTTWSFYLSSRCFGTILLKWLAEDVVGD